MKQLLIFTMLTASTLLATAQKSNAADAIYADLENEENVLTLSLNKQMLQGIDTDVEWNEQIKYLQGDIHKVKVMLIGDEAKGKAIVDRIYKRLRKLGYKQIDLNSDNQTEDESNVWVFSNKKGNTFTEAHFLIKDEDGSGVFMSVYGDFTVTDDKTNP